MYYSQKMIVANFHLRVLIYVTFHCKKQNGKYQTYNKKLTCQINTHSLQYVHNKEVDILLWKI